MLNTIPITNGTKNMGQVWLVGAGPGDPELITVKALRLIQRADVIVHDRLVAPALLEERSPDAVLIDVGKRPGKHTVPQEQIETLLIHHARRGKCVVRLKGGDPFIFGRGGEEMITLRKAGVPVSIVPGITAASGCAAAAGFPLTQRHVADSVCLITAHHSEGSDEQPDWMSLAGDPARTLVFYMGLSQLEHISAQLIHHGLSDGTPAALIENGTASNQRTRYCRLRDIDATAKREQLQTPCLLVVGHVVALAKATNLTLDSHALMSLAPQPQTEKTDTQGAVAA
jgi:uroporphyrin-III C-methyltransferase